jgi:hypothetical protein
MIAFWMMGWNKEHFVIGCCFLAAEKVLDSFMLFGERGAKDANR